MSQKQRLLISCKRATYKFVLSPLGFHVSPGFQVSLRGTPHHPSSLTTEPGWHKLKDSEWEWKRVLSGGQLLPYPRMWLGRGCAYVPSCFSRLWLFATLWTVSLAGSSVVGFSRQEYWSGLPSLPPGHLPNPGVKPTPLLSPALAGRFFTTSATCLPFEREGSS